MIFNRLPVLLAVVRVRTGQILPGGWAISTAREAAS
jgi:hypothetical protein